jgi:putative acetyltransferase
LAVENFFGLLADFSHELADMTGDPENLWFLEVFAQHRPIRTEFRMIRKYTVNDIDAVLDIWLSASIIAHDFVEPSFWESQVENMRNIYIPASETYVYVKDSTIVGFYSLYENNLAAIFVAPERQGRGVGKKLIAHAKNRRTILTLS